MTAIAGEPPLRCGGCEFVPVLQILRLLLNLALKKLSLFR